MYMYTCVHVLHLNKQGGEHSLCRPRVTHWPAAKGSESAAEAKKASSDPQTGARMAAPL